MSEAAGSKATEHGLTIIPVTPPPNLAELIGYPGAARYVAFYYMGTCATWDDGLASATFSFFGVYSPLIEHPVMAIHLLDADLGSDDGPPTHALVVDREGGAFLVGSYDDAIRLVRSQFDEEARRAAGERYAAIFGEPTTLDEFQRAGMFEVFAPGVESRTDTEGLLRHLDRQITEELVRRYTAMLKGEPPDMRAFGPLRYIQRRFFGGRGEGQTDAA